MHLGNNFILYFFLFREEDMFYIFCLKKMNFKPCLIASLIFVIKLNNNYLYFSLTYNLSNIYLSIIYII